MLNVFRPPFEVVKEERVLYFVSGCKKFEVTIDSANYPKMRHSLIYNFRLGIKKSPFVNPHSFAILIDQVISPAPSP